MRGWTQVYIKELREFARDRRLLFSALLGPVILEVLLITIFAYADTLFREPTAQRLMVINRDEGEPVLSILEETGSVELSDFGGGEVAQALRDRQARLVIEFPEGFREEYEARRAPEFIVHFDRNEMTSQMAIQWLDQTLLRAVREEAEARMRTAELDPNEFVAFVMRPEVADTGKPFAGAWLVGFLPYLIVIWAFYGGFAIVGDLVAGEKERGSLETLLIAPISRTAIAFGKFLALASLSLVSCISALLGVVIMAMVPLQATQNLFEDGLTISLLSVFAIIVTLIPMVVFFAGTLLAVSTFARNQREVQGYLSLISFVVLVPAIFSQFIGYTDAAASRWVSFVPVLNTAHVIREALLQKVDWTNMLITAGVSSVFAIAGLWLAIRLFSRESVLMRT